MNLQEAKTALVAWQNKMSAYYHAMGILYYDGDTVAPKGTAENRAHTLGILSEESYKISTSPETLEMLEFLDAHTEELDENEKLCVNSASPIVLALSKADKEKSLPVAKQLLNLAKLMRRPLSESESKDFSEGLCQLMMQILE